MSKVTIHKIYTFSLVRRLMDVQKGIWLRSQIMELIDSPHIQVEVWRHTTTEEYYICPMRENFQHVTRIDTESDLERYAP